MFRKTILASAISLVLIPGIAGALGLGGIRTQSALNEPFVAEIDVQDVRPDELDTVKVILASEAEFSKVGAARHHFLTGLSFSPRVSARGGSVILVSSSEPIREPYMDFLVEVNWPKGRLIKEYTVLLDPPVTLNRPPPPVEQPAVRRAAPAPQPRPAPAPAPAAPAVASQPSPEPESATISEPSAEPAAAAASEPKPAAQPAETAAPASAEQFPLRHGPVKRGAGLWRIARSMAPPGATVAQTAMALYRNNQSAFIRGDINKLMVGANLEIPSSAELLALDEGAAEGEFHAALRGKKVTAAPIAPAVPEQPPEQQQQPVQQQPQDQLKIAEAQQPTDATPPEWVPQQQATDVQPELGDVRQELLLMREASESARQESEHLHSRVLELETQLADIRQLLQLRNEQLAQLQQQQAQGPDTTVVEGTQPEQAVETQTGQQAAEGTEVGPAGQEGGTPDAAPEGTDTPTVADTQVPAEPESTGPAFWESLPRSTLGLGVAIPLLLLLGWAVVRRRKRLESSLRADELATEPVQPELAVAGAAAGAVALQASEMGEAAATAPASTSISGLGTLEDETEEADIISEADVYIAYGRYREAQSLLEEEIDRHPERVDLKYKLAEAYFGARDLDSLTKLVDDMRATGMEHKYPGQWQRLTTMVRDLRGTDDEEPAPVQEPQAEVPQVEELQAEEPPSPFPEPEQPAPMAPEAIFPDEEVAKPDAEIDLGLDQSAPTAEEPQESEDFVAGFAKDFGFDTEPEVRESQELELDVEDLDMTGGKSAEVESEELPVSSDMELKLDDTGEVASTDTQAESLGETQIPTTEIEELAQSTTQATSDLSQGGSLWSGAVSDSGDMSAVRGDNLSSDLLSSQWQVDSGLWDEVATKIDLARAYIEMEDSNAARAILEEVAEEGNEEQRVEAEEMLGRLK